MRTATSRSCDAAPVTLVGEVVVPGDKSCTHRALMLGTLAAGRTEVRGALDAADTRSTASVASSLGATVNWPAGSDALTIDGVGDAPLRTGTEYEPLVLDCGNAGTAARLWAGVLAGRDGHWTLDGDASLRTRPMARVTRPLSEAGARFDGERLPLTVHGGALAGYRHVVELASAQVKSALLLSGLAAGGPTTVVQHAATRDHTERMLPRFGVRCDVEPGEATVTPGVLTGAVVDVPADPSSAAFFAVLAAIVEGAEIVIPSVGLWPRRIGFLGALEAAGADVSIAARDRTRMASLGGTAMTDRPGGAGDPTGALRAAFSPELRPFTIEPREVPDLVDEIPILAVAAACVRGGVSEFRGLAELRVKESNRIATVAELLTSFGVNVKETDDGLNIEGRGVESLNAPTEFTVHDDHRLAMCQAVLAVAASTPAERERVLAGVDLTSAAVSYPAFGETLGKFVTS